MRLRVLREGTFITRERVWIYGLAMLLIYAGVLLAAYWQRLWFVDPDGRPMAVDFINFWTAGFLTETRDAASLYDRGVYRAAEVQALGHDFSGEYSWFYPPSLLLAVVPLSALPYLGAWVVWVATTATLFVVALRLILPLRLALPLALAAPASLWCAVVGQTGFLVAALMAGCLGTLERRPWISGLCAGLLTCKPQFGVLLPLFLILGRHGRAFAAASVTAVLLGVVSGLLFGFDTWRAFAASLTQGSGSALLGGGAAWFKLQSLFAVAYEIAADSSLALKAHLALCAALLPVLIRLWTRSTPPAVKGAALCAGAFLFTPYAYVYDAVLLTTAVALLVRDGIDRGFGAWEKPLLCLALAVPGTFPALGSLTVPLPCLLLLGIALRRGAGVTAGRRD